LQAVSHAVFHPGVQSVPGWIFFVIRKKNFVLNQARQALVSALVLPFKKLIYYNMDTTTNSLNWFEIPVKDIHWAKHFYQVLFSIHMDEMEMMGMKMAMFPALPASGKASGALVQSEYHIPGMNGTIVYLNANPDMAPVLEKVEMEGGRILLPKTSISPEIGFMAFFADTEGNRVALHSQE
jgi:uncharacterized protein